MDKKKDDNNDNVDTSEVVMRKPRNVFEPADKYSDNNANDGGSGEKTSKKKRVKWSESTELRERLKVYRRSQLDIPLNYQHYAIEEEREREGVKVWRNHLIKGDDENDEFEVNKTITFAVEGACNDDTTDDHDNGAESDEGDLCLDEEMERKIQLIKEHTTRYTLFPAYSAAIPVYEEWLSHPGNIKSLSRDQLMMMRSQLDLYKRLVDIYKEWTEKDADDTLGESRFGEITLVLQEVSELGQPPQCVSKIISEVLADEENVQKQVDVYNNLVQDMLSALDTSTEV